MNRWIPSRDGLRHNRWLRPLARHLDDDRLWHATRASVARAVAIGLFFGLMIPVLQFLFAIVTAIFLRAHVAIAAAATLISNPFTFAPIYWFAWWVGSRLLGVSGERPPNLAPPENAGLGPRDALGLLESTWQSITSVGAPLLLGLFVLAVVASALGYALVWLLWRERGDDLGAAS
ncbi:MAG TPA: DUF2062 domain-containing protein [Caldimonas sp.]|jgi:hypothetical protein|nr:DUF2062 domain-containing protein [Caldimonas sp.]HEX2541053.1 DUF2062 domain-containing protein [Caldimonas sp.]